MAFDFGGLGGAVSDIFGAVGDLSEAGAYKKAAAYATQNAAIAKTSTGIQENQAARQAFQVLGATQAAAGANNLALSGSALDVMKSNAQQTTLQKQLIENQGEIEQAGWLEKASADQGMAGAAKAAAGGGFLGGILKVAGVVAPFLGL